MIKVAETNNTAAPGSGGEALAGERVAGHAEPVRAIATAVLDGRLMAVVSDGPESGIGQAAPSWAITTKGDGRQGGGTVLNAWPRQLPPRLCRPAGRGPDCTVHQRDHRMPSQVCPVAESLYGQLRLSVS